MTKDPTFLAAVKGALPECFVFITMKSDFSAPRRVIFAGGEREVREFFEANGRPSLTQEEINSAIAYARTKQV